MNKIKLISSGIPDLLPQVDRTPNVSHVSEIITRLCIFYGYYNEETELDRSRLELGKAMEWALIQRYKRNFPARYVIPPEISKDGIYGHPDLLDLIDDAVEEMKYTDRSSYGPEVKIGEFAPLDHPIYGTKYWKDWVQVKSYCKMVGWNKGRLNLTHPRGDYREFKVVNNVWERVFTDEELDENWLMMLTNKWGGVCYVKR